MKFEPNSFKLSHEMVMLMGGKYSQGYTLFTNLTVKAFLAIRPYAEQFVNTVHLMLGTGLPSFRGELTIQRLRDRFVLHMNEREAADHMMKVIRNAHENMRSTAYDEFQRVSLEFSLFLYNFVCLHPLRSCKMVRSTPNLLEESKNLSRHSSRLSL